MVQRACKQCSKLFLTWPYSIRNGQGNYCSSTCAAHGRWKQPTIKMVEANKRNQKKAANSRIGLQHSKKTKKQISIHRIGKCLKEKNPRWNGGISIYRRVIKSNKCSMCELKRTLIVHHKNKNRYDNSLSNLQVICYKCHYKVHNGYNRWKTQKQLAY